MGLYVLWLYYSVFALAWFLLGFMTQRYVSTNTNQQDVGITVQKIPVDMAIGTDIMEVYNLHLEHGDPWVEWEFPPTPLSKNKSIVPIAYGYVMENLGKNGLTLVDFVDYDDNAYSIRV